MYKKCIQKCILGALGVSAMVSFSSRTVASPPVIAPAPGTLGAWLEGHFGRVAANCNFRSGHGGTTLVPANVRDWSLVQTHWNAGVTESSAQSVDALFARVYRRENGNLLPVDPPLGVTRTQPAPPVLAIADANDSREHNCITLLAADGNAGMSLAIANIRATLSAATNDNGTETAYFFAGTMISPIAAVLGDSRATDPPPDVGRLQTLLAIWFWYRDNPRFVAQGDAHQLEIYRDFRGIAAYHVAGMTQTSLLRGQGSASGGFLFFTASGSVDRSATTRIVTNQQDYSVAYWSPSMRTLPTTAELSQQVAALSTFTPLTTNATAIENSDPIQLAWDVTGVPAGYCAGNLWTVATSQALPPNRGAVSALLLSPVEGNNRTCRFTAEITPPATPATQMEAVLAVKSTIQLPDNASPRELVLTSRPIRLIDHRASVGLDLASGVGEVAIVGAGRPGAAATRLSLRFPLAEREDARRVTGFVRSLSAANVQCGSAGLRRSLPTPALKLDRSADDASIVVDVDLPADLLAGAAAGARVACQLNGRVMVVLNTHAEVQLDLPTYNFSATLPATTSVSAPITTSGPAAAPRQPPLPALGEGILNHGVPMRVSI